MPFAFGRQLFDQFVASASCGSGGIAAALIDDVLRIGRQLLQRAICDTGALCETLRCALCFGRQLLQRAIFDTGAVCEALCHALCFGRQIPDKRRQNCILEGVLNRFMIFDDISKHLLDDLHFGRTDVDADRVAARRKRIDGQIDRVIGAVGAGRSKTEQQCQAQNGAKAREPAKDPSCSVRSRGNSRCAGHGVAPPQGSLVTRYFSVKVISGLCR